MKRIVITGMGAVSLLGAAGGLEAIFTIWLFKINVVRSQSI